MRFSITNTGRRPGAEVGQVYVGFPASTGEQPKQLKGFKKLALAPGESDAATVELDARAFSVWDAAAHDWVRRPGCYAILVASRRAICP